MFAKQKLSPWRNRHLVFLFALAASFLAFHPCGLRADSLEDAAKALARKICRPPRPGSVEVRWQDTDISPFVFSDSFENAFLAQLSACGIEVSKNAGSPVLTVTAQGTASAVVLTADFRDSAETRSTVMVDIPRAAVSAPNDYSLALRPQREFLYKQERSICSAVEWHEDSTKQDYLFLLSQGFLNRLRLEGNTWIQVDSTELPKPERRLRGSCGNFTLQYPEMKLAVFIFPELCVFDPLSPISFRCDYKRQGEKALSVTSPCDQRLHILWAGKGDYTQRDRIRIGDPDITGFTPRDDDEIFSHSLETPGPVIDIRNGNDPKTATAVVRNLATGNYEVYRITAVCGN